MAGAPRSEPGVSKTTDWIFPSTTLATARTLMYQFRREDMALQAARLLAIYETQPIVVMARGLMDFYTIGPINNVAVHAAGRHMATVYRSGHVDHMGLA